jgi:hypothetical protein
MFELGQDLYDPGRFALCRRQTVQHVAPLRCRELEMVHLGHLGQRAPCQLVGILDRRPVLRLWCCLPLAPLVDAGVADTAAVCELGVGAAWHRPPAQFAQVLA